MSALEINRGSVTTPLGFAAAGIACGLKQNGAMDMAMIYSKTPCRAAAAFTSNLFAAAPVTYDRAIIAKGEPVHAVVVNSGVANACTGEQGDSNVKAMAQEVARRLGIAPQQVLVSSTGRIGDQLPMDKIIAGIGMASQQLSPEGGENAARAIMTTDTMPKHLAVDVKLQDAIVHIGAMTKGAGMIAPKLKHQPPQATMLCYVTTDADIQSDALNLCLKNAIGASFNRITVDGDTSTNDTVIAMANGNAGNKTITPDSPDFQIFNETFTNVLQTLAQAMVLDGEGVSKFVEVNVTGATSDQDAKICAEAIANSALCKTAWFGCDPNWGRVLCAAGYSGIDFNPQQVNLDYDDQPVVRLGMDAGTPEDNLLQVLKNRQWKLNLDLGAGKGSYTVWTCDLTYDYVKINADYHT